MNSSNICLLILVVTLSSEQLQSISPKVKREKLWMKQSLAPLHPLKILSRAESTALERRMINNDAPEAGTYEESRDIVIHEHHHHHHHQSDEQQPGDTSNCKCDIFSVMSTAEAQDIIAEYIIRLLTPMQSIAQPSEDLMMQSRMDDNYFTTFNQQDNVYEQIEEINLQSQ